MNECIRTTLSFKSHPVLQTVVLLQKIRQHSWPIWPDSTTALWYNNVCLHCQILTSINVFKQTPQNHFSSLPCNLHTFQTNTELKISEWNPSKHPSTACRMRKAFIKSKQAGLFIVRSVKETLWKGKLNERSQLPSESRTKARLKLARVTPRTVLL